MRRKCNSQSEAHIQKYNTLRCREHVEGCIGCWKHAGGRGDSKTQACIEWAAWIILLLLIICIIIILLLLIIMCWQGAGRGQISVFALNGCLPKLILAKLT